VAPLPATINGKTGDANILFSTCYLPNFYDLPAGVVPIRLVKESEQEHPPQYLSNHTTTFNKLQ
jgi:hypothetical protein